MNNEQLNTNNPSNKYIVIMFGVGMLLLLFIGLFMSGLFPASSGEREFINDVKNSEYSTNVKVKASISASDDSLFVSKRYFKEIADAYVSASMKTDK